jgi:mevalonate kinase
LETFDLIPDSPEYKQSQIAFEYILSLIKPQEPIKIMVKSELPIGQGLGSSASFSVSIVTCLLKSKGLFIKDLINEFSYKMEMVLHGKTSGVDNFICTFGGIYSFRLKSLNNTENPIKSTIKSTIESTGESTIKSTGENTIKSTGEDTIKSTIESTRESTGESTEEDTIENSMKSIREIPKEDSKVELIKLFSENQELKFLIIDTLIPKNTKNQVKSFKSNLQKYPSIMNNLMNSIDQISKEFIKIYQQKNNDFIRIVNDLIRMNQGLLYSAGSSHSVIDNLVMISNSKNIQCKLTGGGGGGCCIALVSSLNENSVIDYKNTIDSLGMSYLEADIDVDGVDIREIDYLDFKSADFNHLKSFF